MFDYLIDMDRYAVDQYVNTETFNMLIPAVRVLCLNYVFFDTDQSDDTSTCPKLALLFSSQFQNPPKENFTVIYNINPILFNGLPQRNCLFLIPPGSPCYQFVDFSLV